MHYCAAIRASLVAPLTLTLTLALSGALLISGCASRQTTAEQVMFDSQLQRQNAEHKPQMPDNRKLYLSLIVDMQAKGLFYASLAHIEAFEKKFGPGDDIELLRGDALRETGQGDAALAVYRPLSSGADGARALHGIGRVLAMQGKWSDAIDALSAAVALDPINVSYLNDLAFADMRASRVSSARLPIAQASELAPENKKVIANLVLYLLLSGDQQRATEVIGRAKLAPETVQATRALAVKMAQAPAFSEPLASAAPLPYVAVAKTAPVSASGMPQNPLKYLAKPAPAVSTHDSAAGVADRSTSMQGVRRVPLVPQPLAADRSTTAQNVGTASNDNQGMLPQGWPGTTMYDRFGASK